jgi:hypothetical protein
MRPVGGLVVGIFGCRLGKIGFFHLSLRVLIARVKIPSLNSSQQIEKSCFVT